MDWGSKLSEMFGDHKAEEVTKKRWGNGSMKSTDRFRSKTTNSYNKCIREISHNFPQGIEDIAIKAIDKHDQNNFEEKVELGNVYEDSILPSGEKRIVGKTYLCIKGTYQFKIFAHCKTVEMWIETVTTKNSTNSMFE